MHQKTPSAAGREVEAKGYCIMQVSGKTLIAFERVNGADFDAEFGRRTIFRT